MAGNLVRTAAVALGSLGMLLAPPAARAAEVTLTPASQVSRAGRIVALQVTAPTAGTCQLRFGAYRLPVSMTGAAAVGISGRVSPRASRGAHALSFTCGASRVRARVDIRPGPGRRHASPGRLFSGPLRITTPIAAEGSPVAASPITASLAAVALLGPPRSTPFPRPALPASPEAHAWWADNADAVLGSFRNGQCTDWAQRLRPDILHNVYLWRYDHYGAERVMTNWDARFWTGLAAEAGLPIAHQPVVGAIMVYAPGSYGAGSTGHVAVVEAVAVDGSFAVSHTHAPNVGEVTQQVYSGPTAAAMANDPGIAFLL